MKFFLTLFLGFYCLFFLVGCQDNNPTVIEKEEPETVIPVDTLTVMEHLQERGVLKAVTNRQHLNYHLKGGKPSGFQFELLDDFCEQAELRLDLLVNDSIEDCYRLLTDGSVDLFAGIVDSTLFNDTLFNDSTFHNILIETPVDLDEKFVWILPKVAEDSSLTCVINDWLEDYGRKGIRNSFYRYFPNGRNTTKTHIDNKHICEYDNLIKAEAKKIHWDWRLIASIIYQESRFKPDLESVQGAYGLMQLMPIVMETYDIDYESPPEDQLRAAGKLLLQIENELPESIVDSLERQKFVLASYNAGLGNVLESRQKAERNGKDPDVWEENVEMYCPRQTYHFVRDILERYSHYKVLIEP